jgi:hypothetical protein
MHTKLADDALRVVGLGWAAPEIRRGREFKAREAINISPVEPGKTVEVKVTGVIEAEDTVRVASM